MAVTTAPDGAILQTGSRDASETIRVLLLLLFCLPAQLVFGPLGAAGSPANLFAMLLFVWWAISRSSTDMEQSSRSTPLHIAFFCYVSAAMIGYLAGALRPMVAEEISSADRGLLTFIGWAGIFFVVADGLKSRHSLDRVLRTLVAAGVFLAVLGVVQYFIGINPVGELTLPGLEYNHPFGGAVTRSGFNRVQGTASHPIEFGVVLTLVLPLALHYAWNAQDGERAKRWAQVIVIGAALPMTVARSAMLGLAVVGITLFLAWPSSRRKKALLLLPVFAVALRFMLPGLLGTIRGLFLNLSSDPSTQGRTDDYAAILHYFAGAPLFGRGISTFLPSIYLTLDNAYLGWVVEAGLLGLVTLLALMVTAVLCAFRVRSLAADEETRDLAASLGAALLSAIVTFGTFDAFGFPMCAGVYFTLVGATAALWRLSSTGTADSHPETRRPPLRRGIRIGLVGLVAGVVFLVPQLGTGHVYWAEGSLILRSDEGPLRNELVSQAALETQSELVARVMDSPRTHLQLRRQGLASNYTIALGSGSLAALTDRRGSGPLLRVRTWDSDAGEALEARDTVLAAVQHEVSAMQTDAGAPVNTQFRAEVVSAADMPIYLQGDRKRALVAALVIAVLAGIGAAWLRKRYFAGRYPAWAFSGVSAQHRAPRRIGA